MPLIGHHSSPLQGVLLFICFSVKLPIYGLHFWLPMAHVEAPSYGSVILARVLLKLGGVGLMRTEALLALPYLKGVMVAYFMVFILYSRAVCCFQSDFKRLIAYSSVAHIMVVPLLMLTNTLLSHPALLLVMFLHGLSSRLLFIIVGLLYSIFSSRQLVSMRGLLIISPLLGFISAVTFLFSLPAPPFPSFVAEVYFMFSSFMLTPIIGVVFVLLTVLGLVYNLN